MRASLFVALLFLASFASHSAFAQPAEEELPSWQSFDVALEAAADNDRPILIDVYASWCGWCRQLEEDVHADDEVQSFMKEHFEIARLDISAEPETYQFGGESFNTEELAARFYANGTPTTVFLEPDGSYITRLPGYVDAEIYLDVLKFVESGAHENMSFPEFQETR